MIGKFKEGIIYDKVDAINANIATLFCVSFRRRMIDNIILIIEDMHQQDHGIDGNTL